MSNSEFTYLLKEIIGLKDLIASKTINESNGYKIFVSLIPLLASIITSIATIFIAFAIFKRTTKREREFKAENDIKEKEKLKLEFEKEINNKNQLALKEESELYRKLYGQIVGINSLMLDNMKNQNYHRICNHYYSYLTENEISEKDKQIHIKTASNFGDRYISEGEKLCDIQSKYASILGEYIYVNISSSIFEIYKNILKKDPIYRFKEKFDNKKTSEEQWIFVNDIVADSIQYINNEIGNETNKLLKLFIDESQTKIKHVTIHTFQPHFIESAFSLGYYFPNA